MCSDLIMDDLLQVSERVKPRSRHAKRNKRLSPSSEKSSVISVADIFDIAGEVLIDNNDLIDLPVSGVIYDDVTEYNYELDDEDHVLEYMSQYERSSSGFQKSAGGSHMHNTPKIAQHRQKLLNPHKWKQSRKKQGAVVANRTAAKQNIEKQLEAKGLHRQGPAVFERAWCDEVESKSCDKKYKGYAKSKSRRDAVSSGDSFVVLQNALKKSDVKKSGKSSHLLKIVDMQHRDITPEDYELLLQLDDDVAPKTVSQELLSKLETAVPSAFGLTGELCSICMEQFKPEDLLKKLLCGHCFHSPCVDQWLTYSSCACPLDGLSVV